MHEGAVQHTSQTTHEAHSGGHQDGLAISSTPVRNAEVQCQALNLELSPVQMTLSDPAVDRLTDNNSFPYPKTCDAKSVVTKDAKGHSNKLDAIFINAMHDLDKMFDEALSDLSHK